jgi:hypothetical protein
MESRSIDRGPENVPRILTSEQEAVMPVTKSEMMFFAAGAALGAAAGANLPLLKEKFGPLIAAALAGASSAVGDSYAEVAKRVAEKVEAVQDAMAEMKHDVGNAEKTEPSPV